MDQVAVNLAMLLLSAVLCVVQHMAELTVRETVDFSRRVQGTGSRAGENIELIDNSVQ